MNTIDVCLVTKDSKARVRQFGGIPLNKLITETSVPLGLARQRAISKVSTEWFVFIDDDVILASDWYSRISKYMALRDVGVVQGITLSWGLGREWDQAINQHQPKKVNSVPNSKWGRGYSNNALIKTELVRDWMPSNAKLQANEDLELTKYIQRKGYQWLRIPVAAYHLRSWNKIRRNGFWHGKTLRYVSIYTPREHAEWILRSAVYFVRCFLDHFKLKLSWRVRYIHMYQTFFVILGYILGGPQPT